MRPRFRQTESKRYGWTALMIVGMAAATKVYVYPIRWEYKPFDPRAPHRAKSTGDWGIALHPTEDEFGHRCAHDYIPSFRPGIDWHPISRHPNKGEAMHAAYLLVQARAAQSALEQAHVP